MRVRERADFLEERARLLEEARAFPAQLRATAELAAAFPEQARAAAKFAAQLDRSFVPSVPPPPQPLPLSHERLEHVDRIMHEVAKQADQRRTEERADLAKRIAEAMTKRAAPEPAPEPEPAPVPENRGRHPTGKSKAPEILRAFKGVFEDEADAYIASLPRAAPPEPKVASAALRAKRARQRELA